MRTKRLEIKQKIFATLVMVVMLIMIFSNLEFKRVIGASNVIMNQTVSAGSLSLSTVGSFAFNSAITVGTATNSLGNLIVVNVLDYRGSGAGWTSTINASDFFLSGVSNTTAGYFFASTTSYVWPGNTTITAYNGESTTGMAVGGVNGSLSAPRTLFNAGSTYGMGAYYIGNVMLNIVYSGSASQQAGTYTATSSVTVA